jgi:predicted membrane-bound mannosyltransferase
VECTSPAGADVTLDGSASTDPENNIALFAWRRDSRTGADVGGDPVVHVTQPLGVTQPYVLAVVDAEGQASTDTTAVTVLDSTAPTITSVSASPATLSPPNHEMVPVTVTITATDTCGTSTCAIASVTSNEPVNGSGDGNTAVDWQIIGPNTANVRAERSGGGSGRVYTLTVRCTDPSGNASTGTTTVAVAH